MTSNPPTKTGKLGRRRVTGALNGLTPAGIDAALAQGRGALRAQLRVLLALCQANPPRSPVPFRAPNVQQARLSALHQLLPQLTMPQRLALLKESRALANPELRPLALAKLLPYLPEAQQAPLQRELWAQQASLADGLRAELLLALAPSLPSAAQALPSNHAALIIPLARGLRNTEARLRALAALAVQLPATAANELYLAIFDELRQTRNEALIAKAYASIAATLPAEHEGRALEVALSIQHPLERVRALTELVGAGQFQHLDEIRHAALMALDKIENEEERAEALIAFAPHLESAREGRLYPQILERALTTAILISRRHTRARVLVALAPHLTADLQGEALAAVHSLASERERAQLLAQLAPNLPPNMLVASLAVAHTMREQDSRVHALTVLAHHAPESARAQTMLDALAAASNLPHHYERVRALLGLADILAPALREQALNNAIETTRLIENENARSRAIALLAAFIADNEVLGERALLVARELSQPEQRLSALLALANALPKLSLHEDLLACAHALPLEYKRARALVSIAAHLPTARLNELQSLSDAFSDPLDRANVLLAIAQHTPPEARAPYIARTWALLPRVEEGYDRATLIASLATYLPERARQGISSAIRATVAAIADDYDRASAISILAPLLREGYATTPSDPLPSPSQVLTQALLASCAPAIPLQQRADLVQRACQAWLEAHTPDANAAFTLWASLAPSLATLGLADALLCLGALVPLLQCFSAEAPSEIALILGLKP